MPRVLLINANTTQGVTQLIERQVRSRLREEFAVYLVRSGRLCVAGLNSGNVEATGLAMAAVLDG